VKKKWTYQQIGPYNRAGLLPLLLQASLHYKDPRYALAAALLSDGKRDSQSALLRIIY